MVREICHLPLINMFLTGEPYGCIVSFIVHYMKMTRRLTLIHLFLSPISETN